MIKFKQGVIRTYDGKTKDIIVTVAAPNNLKDILIGGSAVLIGIAYLTYTAFRNGSSAFETAEYQTLMDLGLIGKDKPGE